MDLDQRVEATSFRYLVDIGIIPVLGSVGGSILVAASQIAAGALYSEVAIWLALVYLSLGIRLWMARRQRAQLVSKDYQHPAAMRYSLSYSTAGIAWGLAILLLPNASPYAQFITIAITQAMVMGSVMTLGIFLPAFLSFALPAMLPMIIISIAEGDTQNMIIATYSTLFLGLFVSIAVRFNRSMQETWKTRFDNDDLVKALTEAQAHLAIQAQSDGLTGLANRRRFDDVLETEFARARRSGEAFSLIFLDVDYFKAYNDTYGHLEGDQCLQKIARTLQQQLFRASDFAARFGGEEFTLILPETNHAGAKSLAEKIRHEVAALQIPHSASQVHDSVTVSLGVITLNCAAIASPAEALSLADRQLYQAKAEGRNRVVAVDLRVSPTTEKTQDTTQAGQFFFF